MAKYLIMATNNGFAEVEAENEKEALSKAQDMKYDNFDWTHFENNRMPEDTVVVGKVKD